MVWIADPSLRASCLQVTGAGFTSSVTVSSWKELLQHACAPDAFAFVDASTLETLSAVEPALLPSHIVTICDDTLQVAVNWLHPHPWLGHVVSASMLQHPMAGSHLKNLTASFSSKKAPRLLDWLGPEVEGRRIRLTDSRTRVARLQRMTEYLDSKGVGTRTSEQLRDAAEELLTNAFYDAPVSAGAIERPISRTQDVTLPEKHACDLAYGCDEEIAVVRVRDPFGSLSRRRLVQVLLRCARPDGTVEVDESMGGAGLGMWRIFATATFVAISVEKHSHTEILVGFAKRPSKRSSSGTRPFAFHLFFGEGQKRKYWRFFTGDTTSNASVDQSVMLELKSK